MSNYRRPGWGFSSRKAETGRLGTGARLRGRSHASLQAFLAKPIPQAGYPPICFRMHHASVQDRSRIQVRSTLRARHGGMVAFLGFWLLAFGLLPLPARVPVWRPATWDSPGGATRARERHAAGFCSSRIQMHHCILPPAGHQAMVAANWDASTETRHAPFISRDAQRDPRVIESIICCVVSRVVTPNEWAAEARCQPGNGIVRWAALSLNDRVSMDIDR
jgi:hypothetical protein